MCRTPLVLLLVFVACVYETSSQWKMYTYRHTQEMKKHGAISNIRLEDLIVQYGSSGPKYIVPHKATFYLQETKNGVGKKSWTEYTFSARLDQNVKLDKFVIMLKGKALRCVYPSDLVKKLNDGTAQIRIAKDKKRGQAKDFFVTNKNDGKKISKPIAGAAGSELKMQECTKFSFKHRDQHPKRYGGGGGGGLNDYASEQYWNEYDDEDFGDSNAVDSERESDRDMIFPMMISVMMGIAGCCIVAICCTALGMLFGFVIGYSVYANDKREREPESIEVAVAN